MASNTSTGNDADLSDHEDRGEDQESDVISLMKAALPDMSRNMH